MIGTTKKHTESNWKRVMGILYRRVSQGLYAQRVLLWKIPRSPSQNYQPPLSKNVVKYNEKTDDQ